MSVAFEGFQEAVTTFRTSGTIAEGAPVKMASSDTVAACASGDVLIGIAVQSDSMYTTVRLHGAVTMPFTGTAPTVGFTKLVAGSNAVKTGTAGREYLVVSVDATASTVTFLL